MGQAAIPFSTLVSQLNDTDSQVRLQAIKSIVHRPAERGKAFASLLALLNDPDERVLKAAIGALGTLGNSQAMPVLAQILSHHAFARVRLRALRALMQISRVGAKVQVLAALRDDSAQVRRAAVVAVGFWRDPHVLHPLLALLADPYESVRASVVKVLKSLGDVQKVDPLLMTLESAETYNRRGERFRAWGLYKQAEADFTQAIQLEPDYAQAYQNRGSLYAWDLGRQEPALADFTRLVQLQPESMRAYFERGSTYVRLRQHAEAVSDFDRVIADAQESDLTATAYQNRSSAHMRLRAYQQALADCERMLELGFRVTIAHNGRGCIYHRLKDYQQALIEFTRAIELNPAQALFYSNRGEIYQCLCQFDQAITDFEWALVLNPDLPDTRGFLAKARNGEQADIEL